MSPVACDCAGCSGASVGSLGDAPVRDEARVCSEVAPDGTVSDVLPVVLMPDDDTLVAGTVWYKTWYAEGEIMLVDTDVSAC